MHPSTEILAAVLLVAVVCTGPVCGQPACATVVPLAPGYLYFPRLDTDPPSEGIELDVDGPSAASYLESRFKLCNATMDCVAVNSLFVLKSARQLALPLRTYDQLGVGCSSIYIKSDFIGRPFTVAEKEACKEDSRTVVVFGQYTFIPLRDSPSPLGTQITPIVPTLQRSALLAACDADTTCIAVNTNGYLKDEVEPQPTSTYPEQWITGACGGIYIKTSAVPADYLAAYPEPLPSPPSQCALLGNGCCSGEADCDKYNYSDGNPPPACKCGPYLRDSSGVPRCSGPKCVCLVAGLPSCTDLCRQGCAMQG